MRFSHNEMKFLQIPLKERTSKTRTTTTLLSLPPPNPARSNTSMASPALVTYPPGPPHNVQTRKKRYCSLATDTSYFQKIIFWTKDRRLEKNRVYIISILGILPQELSCSTSWIFFQVLGDQSPLSRFLSEYSRCTSLSWDKVWSSIHFFEVPNPSLLVPCTVAWEFKFKLDPELHTMKKKR